jgi:hypothetical protein
MPANKLNTRKGNYTQRSLDETLSPAQRLSALRRLLGLGISVRSVRTARAVIKSLRPSSDPKLTKQMEQIKRRIAEQMGLPEPTEQMPGTPEHPSPPYPPEPGKRWQFKREGELILWRQVPIEK